MRTFVGMDDVLAVVLGLDFKTLRLPVIFKRSTLLGLSRELTFFLTASKFDLATTVKDTFSFRLKMKA